MTDMKLPLAMAELRPALGEIVGRVYSVRLISPSCFRPSTD